MAVVAVRGLKRFVALFFKRFITKALEYKGSLNKYSLLLSPYSYDVTVYW